MSATRLPGYAKACFVLTRVEIEHILNLINLNEVDGHYFGNRQQYEKRTAKIKKELEGAIEAKPTHVRNTADGGKKC